MQTTLKTSLHLKPKTFSLHYNDENSLKKINLLRNKALKQPAFGVQNVPFLFNSVKSHNTNLAVEKGKTKQKNKFIKLNKFLTLDIENISFIPQKFLFEHYNISEAAIFQIPEAKKLSTARAVKVYIRFL